MAGTMLIVAAISGLAALVTIGLVVRRIVRIRRFQNAALRSTTLPSTAAEFRAQRARDRIGVPHQRNGTGRESQPTIRAGQSLPRHARVSRSLYVPRSPIVIGVVVVVAVLATAAVIALTRTSGTFSASSQVAVPGSLLAAAPLTENDMPVNPADSMRRSDAALASTGDDERPVSTVAFTAKSSGTSQLPLHASQPLPEDVKVQVKVVDQAGREIVHTDVTVGPQARTSDVSVSLIAGETYQAVVDGPGVLDVRVLG